MRSEETLGSTVEFDPVAVGAAFAQQVRRGPDSDSTGVVVEVTSRVARWSATDGCGWSEIAWCDLDRTCADEVIAAQVSHFLQRQQGFVWRVYGYDQPTDLAERLLRSGFGLDGHSTLMVAEAGAISTNVEVPEGIQLVPVHDGAGVDLLIDVHEKVFGTDHSQLRRSIMNQLERSPAITSLVVAMVEDLAVSSARIEFLPARSFASLWGGSTLPQWRGRGIYRALVAYRAQLAVTRGYQYLYVSASSESRPILQQLGFTALSAITTLRGPRQAVRQNHPAARVTSAQDESA